MGTESCSAVTPVPAAEGPDGDARLAALCKALAHPHRVHMLRFLLAQQRCFAGELTDELPVAASTVSQHLMQLRDAGLVRGEVDGPSRRYRVAPAVLAERKQLVSWP